MVFKHVLLVAVFILFSVCLVSASQNYWVDPVGNTYFNVNMSGGQSQIYFINTTGGYAPNPYAVFPMYDNFTGTTLNNSLWTGYLEGGATTQTVNNGLTLAGLANTSSSSGVVSNYVWTNGSELVVNQSISDAYYTDVGFGYGTPFAGGNASNTSWYHTMLPDGFTWIQQDINSPLYARATSQPTTGLDSYQYIYGKGTIAEYSNINAPYTQAYGYDQNGVAYTDWLNLLPTYEYRTKLNIPTYDGSGQAINPSIYYNASGLWGFKYWMLYTPLPNGNYSYENPSLVASNDGITWTTPKWISNPIDLYPGNGRLNNDPDMVYNAAANRLECYWLNSSSSGGNDNYILLRYVNQTEVSNRISTIGGGNTLGYDPTGAYTINGWGMSSPQNPVFILDNGTYWAYTVESGSKPVTIVLYKSTDGLNFTFVQRMNVTAIPGQNIWHMDAEKTVHGVNFLFCENNILNSLNHTLYFGQSTSYTGNITVQTTPLLAPGVSGSWDDTKIYRSCSVTDPNGQRMNIWYSGRNSTNVWGMGFIRVEPNSQGIYQTVPLIAIPRARAVSYQNITWLNTVKNWIIAKGVATSNRGGTRTVNYAYIRPIGHDPLVSIQKVTNGYSVTLTPIDTQTVNNYVVELPAYDLQATNSMDIELTGNAVTDVTINSTQQNPTHSYGVPGVYTISGTVINGVSQSTIQKALSVISAQTAAKNNVDSDIITEWGKVIGSLGVIIVVMLLFIMYQAIKGREITESVVTFVLVSGSMIIIGAIMSYVLFQLLAGA